MPVIICLMPSSSVDTKGVGAPEMLGWVLPQLLSRTKPLESPAQCPQVLVGARCVGSHDSLAWSSWEKLELREKLELGSEKPPLRAEYLTFINKGQTISK